MPVGEDMTLGPATKPAKRWRRPNSMDRPEPWLFVALWFYLALVGGQVLRLPFLVAGALAAPAALLILVAVRLLLSVAIQAAARRWARADHDVRPPPVEVSPSLRWQIAPRPAYPAWALGGGQCGWVQARLRVDGRGRVRAVQVLDQAPARTFERAAVEGFYRAVARMPDIVDPSETLTTTIVFVTSTQEAPPWAQKRLAARA